MANGAAVERWVGARTLVALCVEGMVVAGVGRTLLVVAASWTGQARRASCLEGIAGTEVGRSALTRESSWALEVVGKVMEVGNMEGCRRCCYSKGDSRRHWAEPKGFGGSDHGMSRSTVEG